MHVSGYLTVPSFCPQFYFFNIFRGFPNWVKLSLYLAHVKVQIRPTLKKLFAATLLIIFQVGTVGRYFIFSDLLKNIKNKEKMSKNRILKKSPKRP